MKSKKIALIALLFVNLLCYSQKKVVELPLTTQNGYGPFSRRFGGLIFFSKDFTSENESNPLRDIYLKLLSGTPKDLTDMQYGFVETPIKTNIYFVLGKDSEGIKKIVVDANNNLDLRDDTLFTPIDMSVAFLHKTQSQIDSLLAQSHIVNISYETFVNNETVFVNFSVFIAYNSQLNMWMYNFPQYVTTQFKGKQIAIFNFTNLSYNDINLAFVPNDLKNGEIRSEDLYKKSEYIEIEDVIYKILEVNTYKNTLVLEKNDLSKSQLFSTQKGYYPYPFQGKELTTNTTISLAALKGKYVLIDFWAEWCIPCIAEFPHLKELYSKTDRTKFEIIGIAGQSSFDGIKKLIDKHEITWPQIFSDDTNKIIEDYEIRAYPTVFLIDTEGTIIAKDLRGNELEEKILSLIKD